MPRLAAVTITSFRLDVGATDHLAPFLGFLRDKRTEVGRRSVKHGAVQFDEPSLDVVIGKAGVELLVEFLDDLRRRVLGCAESVKQARLEAWQKITNSREIWQRLRT